MFEKEKEDKLTTYEDNIKWMQDTFYEKLFWDGS